MSIVARLNRRITQLAIGRRLPHRTVRVRLTLLYGGLFLLSGTALVGITYGLFEWATAYTKPQLPRIPHTPAIQHLQSPSPLAQAVPQVARVQFQLTRDQHMLLRSVTRTTLPGRPMAQFLSPVLVQDENQLAQDQHHLAQSQQQLAHAVSQLADAVHQMTRAGSVQAAQRAADSHQLLVSSGIALGIVAVLALLAGWLLAGRMLRPIRTITRRSSPHRRTAIHACSSG